MCSLTNYAATDFARVDLNVDMASVRLADKVHHYQLLFQAFEDELLVLDGMHAEDVGDECIQCLMLATRTIRQWRTGHVGRGRRIR